MHPLQTLISWGQTMSARSYYTQNQSHRLEWHSRLIWMLATLSQFTPVPTLPCFYRCFDMTHVVSTHIQQAMTANKCMPGWITMAKKRYAQVRMLFSCQDLQRQRHELAFVRWYEVAGLAPRPFQDSTYLRFAQGHSNSDRGQITQPPAGLECYGIVDIHLIDRIVLIQKDHHAAGRFFINRYLRVH